MSQDRSEEDEVEKRYLTVKEAAKYMSYSTAKLYEDLLNRPNFPAYKDSPNAQWRIDKFELDEWIDDHLDDYMVA